MKYCILDNKKICDDCGECNVCDLDPNKICDNCCRCIQKEDTDQIQISLNDLYAKMEQQGNPEFEKLFANEDEDVVSSEDYAEELFDGSTLGPINIDPKLLEEWEARLRELEEEQQPSVLGKNLHGSRKRRR